MLRRQQFGRRSEQLNTEQMSLLDEAIDDDLSAIGIELEQLEPARKRQHEQPKRAREKLDYAPGAFSVERHIRGKWVCRNCETLIQAPVPAHVIDKSRHRASGIGIGQQMRRSLAPVSPGADLCAGRPGDTEIYAGSVDGHMWRAVAATGRRPSLRDLATRGLHADETPVQMLSPGKGKTHRTYLWAVYAHTIQ